MTDKLPPALLRLFTARPPLPPAPQLDRDPLQRRGPELSGIAAYLPLLKEYDPGHVRLETAQEAKARRVDERREANEHRIAAELENYCPKDNAEIPDFDPFRTIFVGRLSYDAGERDLMRAFDRYGEVKKVKIVMDKKSNKPRGYAFVEFDREKDAKCAYNEADGMRICERRIVVDVERGRTVKDWKPTRLGGGLGKTRVGYPWQNQRTSGRDPSLQTVSTSEQQSYRSRDSRDDDRSSRYKASEPRYRDARTSRGDDRGGSRYERHGGGGGGGGYHRGPHEDRGHGGDRERSSYSNGSRFHRESGQHPPPPPPPPPPPMHAYHTGPPMSPPGPDYGEFGARGGPTVSYKGVGFGGGPPAVPGPELYRKRERSPPQQLGYGDVRRY